MYLKLGKRANTKQSIRKSEPAANYEGTHYAVKERRSSADFQPLRRRGPSAGIQGNHSQAQASPYLQRLKTDGAGGSSLPDYTVYKLSQLQKILCIAIGGMLFYGVGYLFYHQWILAMLWSATGLLLPRFYRDFLLHRRRSSLSIQFKQALYSLSSSLAAGRSVENGFREAIEDLRLLSPDGDNELIREFNIITARMEIGQPVESALQDFAVRAQMEDITNFADVFATCKRTGGDLIEVVRRTSSVIGEKLDIHQEIGVMIAQKRFESRVMFVAPFLFVLFMNVSAGDYMTPLYSGTGMILSTVCLLVLGGCLLWINKIMKIDV